MSTAKLRWCNVQYRWTYLFIIGEATNKLLKIAPEIPITKARKIVDTRNYMIHGYDSVSHDMVWSIVINHLPLLKEEVVKILTEISTKTE